MSSRNFAPAKYPGPRTQQGSLSPLGPGSELRSARDDRLLAEVLQGDLDALVVHLLEVGLELVAALGAAMEELGDVARSACAPGGRRLRSRSSSRRRSGRPDRNRRCSGTGHRCRRRAKARCECAASPRDCRSARCARSTSDAPRAGCSQRSIHPAPATHAPSSPDCETGVSGNGIFTDVTRLMTLRTSSRSAAVADVNGTHSRKLAKKKGLADWSIGKPPKRAAGTQATWGSMPVQGRAHG